MERGKTLPIITLPFACLLSKTIIIQEPSVLWVLLLNFLCLFLLSFAIWLWNKITNEKVDVVKQWLKTDIPRDKLILGLASFGRSYELENALDPCPWKYTPISGPAHRQEFYSHEIGLISKIWIFKILLLIVSYHFSLFFVKVTMRLVTFWKIWLANTTG